MMSPSPRPKLGTLSPPLVCSCGRRFQSRVIYVQDFDDGDNSLAAANCPHCGSTRCWEVEPVSSTARTEPPKWDVCSCGEEVEPGMRECAGCRDEAELGRRADELDDEVVAGVIEEERLADLQLLDLELAEAGL